MAENNLNIKLRPTKISDLDILFEFQMDKESGYLAAFMPKNPTDKFAYIEKYTKLLDDATVNNQTIMLDNIILEVLLNF